MCSGVTGFVSGPKGVRAVLSLATVTPFVLLSTSVFGTCGSYLIEECRPRHEFDEDILWSATGQLFRRLSPSSSPARSQSRRHRRASRWFATPSRSATPTLDKRVSRLELQLLARDAQIEDLQTRLEDTRAEVVRAMAKLQSVASRAQAASAMAEAEVALQTMKAGDSSDPPEAAQVTRLVRQSATEFDKANYGGALYLANQAKTVASGYRGRLGVSREGARPGETLFAVPIKLKTTSRGNVREGPGTNFPVSFTAESGSAITGFSFADEWVRVADDTGRTGWIHQTLVARP